MHPNTNPIPPIPFFDACDDWPSEIKTDILDSVNDAGYNAKPNTYSLTELLYCIRKAYYRRTDPQQITDVKRAFPLFIGKLLDERWTTKFTHNQVRTTYKCKNIPTTISGKYDYLTNTFPHVLTDLKIVKTLQYVKQNNQPSAEYVKQVRFYAYLNSLSSAAVQYVSLDGEAKKFNVDVGDCTSLFEELETKAGKLYTALLTHQAPESEQGWLCNYCEYQQKCLAQEQGQ